MSTTDRATSYLGLLAGSLGTLGLLAGIALIPRGRPDRPAAPPPAPVVVAAPTPEPPAVVEPALPPVARPIEPDRAAIARAESALDGAARARGVAESRLADAGRDLRAAAIASAADLAASRSLAANVKDPTARIERATNRVTLARWEARKLGAEVVALAKTPRTKARPLVDQAAVARPIDDGKEFHFEVRRDRVAYVDVEGMSELVKTDVRLRVKLAIPGQTIGGKVGPVGDFSMRYEMGPSLSGPLAELLDARQVSYQLQGWEIVPEHPSRGVAYESAWGPGSEFGRVIRRLNPASATITLWIYPEGFPLYRRLRDDLHAKGFLVAARPLPEGMAIRGSPVGSLSAGQ